MNEKTQKIRIFICQNIELSSSKLTTLVIERFSISRQAVHVHIQNLLKEKLILAKKKGKFISYSLKSLFAEKTQERILKNSNEYNISEKTIIPFFQKLNLSKNVSDIWMYGFSEMVNNLIDHSSSKLAEISLSHNYLYTEIKIHDIGIGIFKNLEKYFKIKEPQYALLELFKGKLTSNSSRHSGEGIFFTSRMFDFFQIRSGSYSFLKELSSDLWKLEEIPKQIKGTEIVLRLNNLSERQINDVFLKYVVGDDFKFTKTEVRIELAEYGDVYLVSRSQAKRILSRLENFTEVVFDFKNVEKVSPAFADELFRVSKNLYPKLKIKYCHAEPIVEIFIRKAIHSNTQTSIE